MSRPGLLSSLELWLAPNIGGEPVPAPAHRLDQLRIAAVGFDFAAQPADLIVDRPVEQMRFAPLHHIEQSIAVEHLPGMVERGPQQPEFRSGNRDYGTVGIQQLAL